MNLHKQWKTRLKKAVSSLPGWTVEEPDMLRDHLRKQGHAYLCGRVLCDAGRMVQCGLARPGQSAETLARPMAPETLAESLPIWRQGLADRMPADQAAQVTSWVCGPEGAWAASGPALALLEAAESISEAIFGKKDTQ